MPMSPSSDPKQPTRATSRVPHSFLYDRLIPAFLVVLAVVLVVVMALVIGALAGVIPVK
jgi:hypothetical protein